MKKLLALTAMLMTAAGCADGKNEATGPASDGTERPLVVTTSYPLKYFVERIAAPMVDVRFLVPADEDPAYWRPGPEDVLAMQKADLIVTNGASYEGWLKNVSLPPSRLVDTTDGLRDWLIPLEKETTHSHGLEGEHEHSGTAFTTWLDLTLAATQAGAVKDALAARWPQHSNQFQARLFELAQELTALDAAAQEAVVGRLSCRCFSRTRSTSTSSTAIASTPAAFTGSLTGCRMKQSGRSCSRSSKISRPRG